MVYSSKYFPLNNGFRIPAIGLGTLDVKSAEVEKTVLCAIDAGYRHIDCAAIYENEFEIGLALQKKFAYGSLKREDLFITSKLWCDSHSPGTIRKACEESLENLGLKFLDLYLIHWPMAFRLKKNKIFSTTDASSYDYETTELEITWQEMEKLVDAGLVKSIGLSNFNRAQIERILKICTIKPVVLQIESSVNFLNQELVDFAKSYGIQVTAYATFGSPSVMREAPIPSLLEEQFVKNIAKKYYRSPAQILLRHAFQRGLITIPKSVNPERIRSNLNIFNFELNKSEMDILSSSGRNYRLFSFPALYNHPEYPFKNENGCLIDASRNDKVM